MSGTARLTVQAHRDQQLGRSVASHGSRQPLPSITQADQHIFEGREAEKRPNQLECSSETAATDFMGRQTVRALAEKLNLAAVRNECTAYEIKQGRLSRSVRPHHAKNFSRLNHQADGLNSGNTAKSF